MRNHCFTPSKHSTVQRMFPKSYEKAYLKSKALHANLSQMVSLPLYERNNQTTEFKCIHVHV